MESAPWGEGLKRSRHLGQFGHAVLRSQNGFFDQSSGLVSRFGASLCQAPHFAGHHREA